MYLLDTCAVSDFFAGVGMTRERLRRVTPAQVAISSITVMEIQYGFALNAPAKRRFLKPFQSLIATAQTIAFDAQAAEAAASIRSYLKLRGTPIGSWDLLIGATAAAHNCVLVTSNTKEFQRIEGLLLEDWR